MPRPIAAPIPPASIPTTAPHIIPPPIPRAPRRPFADVLLAFMEEKNIRWGELMGGLLIIGCSIALVISFWAEIANWPFFKFGVFTTVTAGLFGLGLYTEHRWKLPTTSRGILLIATLLVPLNFLAFTALSGHFQLSAIIVGSELAALGLFGWLLWSAAKVIAPQWPSLLTYPVVAISASLILLHIFETGTVLSRTVPLLVLAAVPIGCDLIASSAMLSRARRWRTVHSSAGEAILLLLGVLSFSTVLPLALLVHDASQPLAALRTITPLIMLGGAPLLSGGLLLFRRGISKPLAKLRIAGAAVAVLGVLCCSRELSSAGRRPQEFCRPR